MMHTFDLGMQYFIIIMGIVLLGWIAWKLLPVVGNFMVFAVVIVMLGVIVRVFQEFGALNVIIAIVVMVSILFLLWRRSLYMRHRKK